MDAHGRTRVMLDDGTTLVPVENVTDVDVDEYVAWRARAHPCPQAFLVPIGGLCMIRWLADYLFRPSDFPFSFLLPVRESLPNLHADTP